MFLQYTDYIFINAYCKYIFRIRVRLQMAKTENIFSSFLDFFLVTKYIIEIFHLYNFIKYFSSSLLSMFIWFSHPLIYNILYSLFYSY